MTPIIYAWFAAMVIFLVIELITPQFISIWFAFGSVVALILAAVGLPLWMQLTVFVIISGILVFLTRPLYKKFLAKTITPTNADSLIGQTGIVIADINNLEAVGQVKVKGQIWSACSENGDPISTGEKVLIKKIQGVRLFVEKI
ncbi:MAG: NfeD family protein [Bacillota bacterium]|nr:NfeD family protein [Bacillota bacterium]